MKIAIVTGASSGMGSEFIRNIIRRHKEFNEVWAIARHRDKLLSLVSKYGMKVRPIPVDLTKEKDIAYLKQTLEAEKPVVGLLINSAGMGIIGNVSDVPAEDTLSMIDLNITALTSFTLTVLPFIKKGGRIINLSSGSAFFPQPGFAVYVASKSYVLSFSRALNQELRSRGISVTAVCPGPVKTPFFSIAEKHNKRPDWKNMFMADPAAVVNLAMHDALHRKELSVYSLPMKAGVLCMKLLPHSLLLRLMGLIKKK